MKMLMVVIPSNNADRVLDALVNGGYTATYAETHGGMLQQSQMSLFIAAKKEQVDEILEIIENNCRTRVEMNTKPSIEDDVPNKSPVTADLGGAIIFVWDINQIITI
jgi:uncharacterized protein YaaQ